MLSVPTRKRTPLPDLPWEKEQSILDAIQKAKPYFDQYILSPEYGCYEVIGLRYAEPEPGTEHRKVYYYELLQVIEEGEVL